MDKQQQTQILDLFKQGLSFGKIADQMKLPKSTVYRIVSDAGLVSDKSPGLKEDKARYPESVMLRKLEMEHEREMFKLKQEEQKLLLQHKRLRFEQSKERAAKEEKQQQLGMLTKKACSGYLQLLQSIARHFNDRTKFEAKEFKAFVKEAKSLIDQQEHLPQGCNLNYWIQVLSDIRKDFKEQNEEAFEEFQEDDSQDEFEEIHVVISLDRTQRNRLEDELKRLAK
jgi:hypothetical protein